MAATRAPVGPITAASMKVAQIPKPGGEFQIVDREMPDPGPRADEGTGLWRLRQ